MSDWEPLLDQRFLQRGAYLVPDGRVRLGDAHRRDVHARPSRSATIPNSWHPEDALFAPMRGSDGQLLGILSVDEPISGRKPSGDEIDVLVAVSEHAALAVEAAQEAARAKANRDALERLLEVSTRLNETSDTPTLLAPRLLGDLGRTRLRQGRRPAPERRGPPPHASRRSASPTARTSASRCVADELERLLQPEFDIAGCFLIPHDDARQLLPDRPTGYKSARDGRGPHAWQNDWLFVPLHDRRGRRIGYIWADDPVDRLRPEAERLQILRAFANQATTALEQAAQFEEIQNAYEYHRALIDGSPVAIVDFDFEGRVRSWNAGATEIFGWTEAEVIGPHQPDRAARRRAGVLPRRTSQRIALGETMRDLDIRRLHRDGTLIDVSTSAGPIRDTHGDVVGVISLMMDVTARKRSERALAASEGRKDAVLRARSTAS